MRERAKEQEKLVQEKEEQINLLNCLLEWLVEADRTDDIVRMVKDPVFRQDLIEEYQCVQ